VPDITFLSYESESSITRLTFSVSFGFAHHIWNPGLMWLGYETLQYTICVLLYRRISMHFRTPSDLLSFRKPVRVVKSGFNRPIHIHTNCYTKHIWHHSLRFHIIEMQMWKNGSLQSDVNASICPGAAYDLSLGCVSMRKTELLHITIRMSTCNKTGGTGRIQNMTSGAVVSEKIGGGGDFRFSGQPEVLLEFLPIKL